MEAFLDARNLLDPITKSKPRNILTGGTPEQAAERKIEIEKYEKDSKIVRSLLLSSQAPIMLNK